MPSPFPGMDPYLEVSSLWPDVHHELISEIRALLNRLLRPRYVAGVEERVYISDDEDPGRRVIIPDVRIGTVSKPRSGKRRTDSGATLMVAEPEFITLLNEEISEAYIAIREPKTHTLVTVIEILSPTNKIVGTSGRMSFLAKRRDIMASEVHWVEIDLLRGGKPASLNEELSETDYRIVVARGRQAQARYWPIHVRQNLPVIGIPLKGKDPDVHLDLDAVIQSAYDRAGWDLTIDYSKPPVPPLSAADAKWANKLLREKGMR